ncbi:hypothetical protein [Natrialba sp. INN-245]|uniref:hypothetical protein n=1 Tax=Natrialba sp. INN-245 TaxID=2690967 RepID=UPI00131302F9|nr:hypothetical protein [Natrialba sp. INN-245]MWV39269.1 hypothetical protein [Natrialba sp. INN-245]
MPSRQLSSRRAFLASSAIGLGAVLAGCVEPGGALRMTAVETDEQIATEATRAVDSSREPETASLLEEARDRGEADVEGERVPFRPDRPVKFDGVVYEVSWEVVGERTEAGYVVTATIGTDDVGEPEIAFEELPPIDRSALESLPERIDHFEGGDDRAFGMDVEYYHDEEELEESALVPEPEYEVIDVDGEPVGIRTREDERILSTYRYDLEEIATATAYGAELRERSVVLDSLTGDEREFVEEAVEDGLAVVGRDDEAFIGVGERLLETEPIYEDESTGEWLVEYEGTLYWTELDALRTQELVDRLGDEE